MDPQQQQFSDLPAGATIVSAPQTPPASASTSQFSDLPPGATVLHALPPPSSAASPIAPPALTVGSPASQPMSKVDASGNPQSAGNAFMGSAPIPESVANSVSPAVADAVAGVGKGFVKSAAQTLSPGEKTAAAINSATGLNVPETHDSRMQPEGMAEGIGAGLEGVGEFVLTDNALKALPMLQRAEAAIKAEKALKVAAGESPLVAKIVHAGINTLRATVASGVQSEIHGQDAGQGALYGAAGGALGEAGSEAASALFDKLPESLKVAAGKKFVRDEAIQEAKNLGTQDAVKKQLTTEAQNAYDALSQKFGGQVGDSMGRQLDQHILSFGDLADDLKSKAKPVFEQLDQESDGAFQANQNKIQSARQIIRNPASMEALEAAQESLEQSQTEQQKIFSKSKLNPDDLANARSMWRVSSTLDDLHGKLDKAWSIPQAGQEAVGNDAVKLDPKKFNTQLNAAVRSIPQDRLEEAIGKEGIKNLYAMNQALAETVAKESRVAAFDRVVANAAKSSPKGAPLNTLAYMLGTGLGGAAVGGATGAANAKIRGEQVKSGALQGATIGGMVGAGASFPVGLAHAMYTHPNLGIYLAHAAAIGAVPGSQVVKQATHLFNPDTNQVEPVAGNN